VSHQRILQHQLIMGCQLKKLQLQLQLRPRQWRWWHRVQNGLDLKMRMLMRILRELPQKPSQPESGGSQLARKCLEKSWARIHWLRRQLKHQQQLVMGSPLQSLLRRPRQMLHQ